jgi:hypothetical protein
MISVVLQSGFLLHLIEQRGSDAKVVDFLAEITADCPKKQTGNMRDQCAA